MVKLTHLHIHAEAVVNKQVEVLPSKNQVLYMVNYQ